MLFEIYFPWVFTLVPTPLLSPIQEIYSQSFHKVFVLKTSLLLYCTKLSQFTSPTNTVKNISPEGGLNLTVCSSLHKTDWEAKPDQSVLIEMMIFGQNFKCKRGGGGNIFWHGFNGERMILFFEKKNEKVETTYYGENDLFLRIGFPMVWTDFFCQYFLKKLTICTMGKIAFFYHLDFPWHRSFCESFESDFNKYHEETTFSLMNLPTIYQIQTSQIWYLEGHRTHSKWYKPVSKI